MSSIIHLKKPIQAKVSPSQKTFNQHKQKIERLQSKLESVQHELDDCLKFCREQLEPAKKSLAEVFTRIVKILYKNILKPKAFSKKDRLILEDIVLSKIDQIFDLIGPPQDPEILAIIQDLEGIDLKAIRTSEMKQMKRALSELLKKQGIEIDLPEANTENEDEIMGKIAEALRKAKCEANEKTSAKKKSKKELAKELKLKQLEQLQREGLTPLYKQLVKIFHPDLEQNREKKAENEAVMKRLTIAYESKDLHTLLTIQMEWLHRSDSHHDMLNNDQSTIYTSLLKEQVKALQLQIERAHLHPQYFPLHTYIRGAVQDTSHFLHSFYKEIKVDQNYYEPFLENLTGENEMKTIRKILLEA